MRALFLALSVSLFTAGAEDQNSAKFQEQLKQANERISQLEERIKLMTLQQQGAAQFFQAGQALCELDKKQTQSKPEKP